MKTSSRGFSLIEVLVALFLLQLAILALAPLFIFASQATASSGDMGAVGAVAVEQMELLRQTDFDLLAAGGSLTSDVTGFSDTTDPDVILRWEITDDATPPTLKTIEVRAISTQAVLGLPKEITLTNMVTQ
jgi:prepilin-type N-terminal cleavage/methylation domain-containing protein